MPILPDLRNSIAVRDAVAAADLRARLANLIGVPGHLDHAPAFADIVADGLFDIDVLAGLHRPDGGQSVPMVGRGDADDMDGFVVHDAAQVLHIARRASLGLGGRCVAGPMTSGIGVANMGDDAVVAAREARDMIHAAAAHADDRHVEPAIGAAVRRRRRIGGSVSRGAQKAGARQSGGTLEKITAMQKRQHG